MISFGEVSYDDIIEEIKPLLERHWLELAGNKDIRPLDPDWDAYKKLADLGYLKVFVGRIDGELIAYSTFLIQNHLHYKTWLWALNDIYYLDPEFRGNKIGFEFFIQQCSWLKSLGVNQICVQDKLTQSHKQFFESMGFTHTENNYEMIL